MTRTWRDREQTAFRIVLRMAKGTRVPVVGTPETLRRLGYLADVTRHFIAADERAGALDALSARIRNRVTRLCGDPRDWTRLDMLPSSRAAARGQDDVAARWGIAHGLDLSRLRSEMADALTAATFRS